MVELVTFKPKLVEPEKSYTQVALDALDAARELIIQNDADGQPVTQLVVAMCSEYGEDTKGKNFRMRTQWSQSTYTSDLAAVGLLHLVARDLFS